MMDPVRLRMLRKILSEAGIPVRNEKEIDEACMVPESRIGSDDISVTGKQSGISPCTEDVFTDNSPRHEEEKEDEDKKKLVAVDESLELNSPIQLEKVPDKKPEKASIDYESEKSLTEKQSDVPSIE